MFGLPVVSVQAKLYRLSSVEVAWREAAYPRP